MLIPLSRCTAICQSVAGLVDRFGSLGSCKPQIYYYYLLLLLLLHFIVLIVVIVITRIILLLLLLLLLLLNWNGHVRRMDEEKATSKLNWSTWKKKKWNTSKFMDSGKQLE